MLFYSAIVANARAHIDPFIFRLSLFNEQLLLLTLYTIICMTAFVKSKSSRHQVGWFMISIMMSLLGINFLIEYKKLFVVVKR